MPDTIDMNRYSPLAYDCARKAQQLSRAADALHHVAQCMGANNHEMPLAQQEEALKGATVALGVILDGTKEAWSDLLLSFPRY